MRIILLILAALALFTVANANASDTVARTRLAQLKPAPSNLKPVKINPGVIYKKAGQSLAPLRIETQAGTNYVLKLVHAANGREAMLIYVTGGRPFQTKAPLGTYKIRGASGNTWYGVSHLFGQGTRYFKLQSKGRGANSDQFRFYRSGREVHGFRIILIKQAAGNLETEAIKPEDF
jgi:hypothetical protein